MQLVDRYLQAVRFWLPRGQQDDVIAELSEDICSEIEEKESTLGRSLTAAELEALLKQRGRPMLVANRYFPRKSVIGPALYPAYIFTLKIVLFGYLVPWFLVRVGLYVFDPVYSNSHSILAELARAWGPFWISLFSAVGATTLVFAALEFLETKSKFLENWSPSKLQAVRDHRRIPRVQSTVDLAANLVFIGWWLAYMGSNTIFDRGGVRITLSPVWRAFYFFFLATAAVHIVFAAANLLRAQWTTGRAVAKLVLDLAQAAGLCSLLRVNLLAEIVVPQLAPERAARIVAQINLNMARSLPFLAVGCALAIGLADVGRLFRIRERRSGIVQVAATVAMIAIAAATLLAR
ncbi:MAG TPA: hypothetical protein VFO34_09485 [Candidatus Acidoferrales bacterium]|nr:hypothetical protein [Candidatus Acidoferrales bacterium]